MLRGTHIMNAKLKRFIPSLEWLSTYSKATFRSDLAAGLTVAVMLIPQAMAYAALAGLPPIVGLYAYEYVFVMAPQEIPNS